jgi:hypothetical protein
MKVRFGTTPLDETRYLSGAEHQLSMIPIVGLNRVF